MGKAAPHLDFIECAFDAFCGAIRPIAALNYLSTYLASPMYRSAVSIVSAGIGINNLTSSSLIDLRIAMPPIGEQARIAARVEELMKLCDALDGLLRQ